MAADEAPAARSGLSSWLIAAMALVIGIVIGFFSGYEAARREGVRLAGGSTFTEDAIAEPFDSAQGEPLDSAQGEPLDSAQGTPPRVDPEPIVPAPAAPVESAMPPAPAPAPRREPPAPPVEARPAPVERAATGPGSLQVVSRPSGAQVIVDGRAVGTTPLVLPNVPSGRHDVRIELSGFRRWATSVDVPPGTRTRVAASLEQ